MNAIGYIRVSTDEQAREGVSLENQREKIAAYCSLNDMALMDTIDDEGISAKNLNREGAQALISLVKQGKVDAVIVYKLDRLSRSVKDTINLIELFEKYKVAFHSIVDHIDTKTATGRFFLHIMSSLAQMERELIGERTRDALSHKIIKGERVGHVPYGYVLGKDGRTLIKDTKEQEAISLIQELHGKGYTYRAICRELEAKGYEAKEGTGKWHPQKVKNILDYQERRQVA
jgi:DNA invertase Pin-like site-specific DNA recombinase